MHILDTRHCLGEGKYMGIPTIAGKSKRSTFNYIKKKMGKKILSWRGKYLSLAGKEVLIKPVAQAVPSYICSQFHCARSCSVCWIPFGGVRRGVITSVLDG